MKANNIPGIEGEELSSPGSESDAGGTSKDGSSEARDGNSNGGSVDEGMDVTGVASVGEAALAKSVFEEVGLRMHQFSIVFFCGVVDREERRLFSDCPAFDPLDTLEGLAMAAAGCKEQIKGKQNVQPIA